MYFSITVEVKFKHKYFSLNDWYLVFTLSTIVFYGLSKVDEE